jgi:hypothetical protein
LKSGLVIITANAVSFALMGILYFKLRERMATA